MLGCVCVWVSEWGVVCVCARVCVCVGLMSTLPSTGILGESGGSVGVCVCVWVGGWGVVCVYVRVCVYVCVRVCGADVDSSKYPHSG